MRLPTFPSKIFRCLVLLAFAGQTIFPFQAQAQTVLNLPAVGTMVTPSASYAPSSLRGVMINKDNPLAFDFILDTGDSGLTINPEMRQEADKLIKYFLASLTVPEDQVWVNLSPYEKDRIVGDSLGRTEMGRDLLAQDYLLKQLTSSLMYPEDELGKEFWSRVYSKAKELYGTTDIPLDTFNKIWIVPDEAQVFENDGTAFIVNRKLKVMLEEDYLAQALSGKRQAVSVKR